MKILIILLFMIIAIILVMIQVTRRDPLARLTEALVERKVKTVFCCPLKFICSWPSFDNAKYFETAFVPFHSLIQAVLDGKDGGSLKLICDGNQQVRLNC